jgi:hypothetical protein
MVENALPIGERANFEDVINAIKGFMNNVSA